MLLKIFKGMQPGNEAEFEKIYNEFLNNHIVVKDKYFENGDIYLFYKEKTEVGREQMDEIEQIDRAIVTAQKDIMTAAMDTRVSKTELADIEEKLATETDAKEIKSLEESKKNFEGQIKLNEFTIDQKQREIKCLREYHAELIS